MEEKVPGANINKAGKDPLPIDPSNTNGNAGQKVETGVINIKEGISEQSSEWEDNQERNIPDNTSVVNKASNYLKGQSSEESRVEDGQ